MRLCIHFFFQYFGSTQNCQAGDRSTQFFARLVGSQSDFGLSRSHLALTLTGGVFFSLVQYLAMTLVGLVYDLTRFVACFENLLAGRQLCSFKLFFGKIRCSQPIGNLSRRSSMALSRGGQRNFMQNHTKIIIAIDCKIKVALIFMPYLVQMVQFICPAFRAGS